MEPKRLALLSVSKKNNLEEYFFSFNKRCYCNLLFLML